MFYGDMMPKFLRRFEPAKSLPYLPDMATLELAMRHAYHAGDTDPIGAATLGALAPEKLMGARLILAPPQRSLYPNIRSLASTVQTSFRTPQRLRCNLNAWSLPAQRLTRSNT